jgi:hypothetical protein
MNEEIKFEPAYPGDLTELLRFAFSAGGEYRHPLDMTEADKERWKEYAKTPVPRSTYQRVEHALAHSVITDEMVERAAKALEKKTMQDTYEWTDEEFEIWWNKDSRFIARKRVWAFFEGTEREKCLYEARILLEAAFNSEKKA